jgi:hypothetical protein
MAPRILYFFDQGWNCVGSKDDLVALVSSITGIKRAFVGLSRRSVGSLVFEGISVAEKMSWAARRVTTRVEDAAYCLLGIFDVNMPLLYGEEEKAFRRLQEEIIRSTADISVFAWKLPPEHSSESHDQRMLCGILAKEPAAFLTCGNYKSPFYRDLVDFSMSNNGVKLKGHVRLQMAPDEPGFHYILPLQCRNRVNGKSMGIRLKKVGAEQFLRENPWELVEYEDAVSPKRDTERYLLTKIPGGVVQPSYVEMTSVFRHVRQGVLQIRAPPELSMYGAWPPARFDQEDQLFFISGELYGDFGSIALKGSFGFEFEKRQMKVKLDLVFYAFGWRSTERPELQCTILDKLSHADTISELQTGDADWNHDSRYVRDVLRNRKIPKRSRAVQEIQGTPYATVVTFKPSIISDPLVCEFPFWSIVIRHDIVKMKDVPPPVRERWGFIPERTAWT